MMGGGEAVVIIPKVFNSKSLKNAAFIKTCLKVCRCLQTVLRWIFSFEEPHSLPGSVIRVASEI